MSGSRTRFSNVESGDFETDQPVRLHMGLWAMLGIGGLIILAILGITIATLVIVDDAKSEVDKIWKFNRRIDSIVIKGEDSKHGKCPTSTCLLPFGPCTKRLPELLDDFPCCVTVFEDKFVKKFPVKPKHKRLDDDGPESRWKYGYMDEYNSKKSHMSMNKDSWYDMDDGQISHDEESYITIEASPYKKSVGPGEYGHGTGILDTIKFGMSPVGAYAVRQDAKIVLQAVITASTKLPKWHPYEWKGDHDDPRLGHVGPMLWDWDTGIAAGVVFTEKGVWTVYNRMSFKHDVGSWHSAKRVHDNEWGKTWCVRIIYCSKSHTITIFINDKEVYKIKKVGKLPDHDHRDMFVYRGGEPEEAYPDHFYAYLCGGTVLDGKMKDHDDHGLMKLDSYDYVEPTKFKYSIEENKEEKRVFGQKFKIVVFKFKVDICEKAEEPKKPKSSKSKSKSHSHDEKGHKKEDEWDKDWKKESEWDEDWKKENEWKDEDKKENDWAFETHKKSEEWDTKHKEKWELSNSEEWRKWGDDYEHEKSENEKHVEENKEHHENSEEWTRAKGDWHKFSD